MKKSLLLSFYLSVFLLSSLGPCALIIAGDEDKEDDSKASSEKSDNSKSDNSKKDESKKSDKDDDDKDDDDKEEDWEANNNAGYKSRGGKCNFHPVDGVLFDYINQLKEKIETLAKNSPDSKAKICSAKTDKEILASFEGAIVALKEKIEELKGKKDEAETKKARKKINKKINKKKKILKSYQIELKMKSFINDCNCLIDGPYFLKRLKKRKDWKVLCPEAEKTDKKSDKKSDEIKDNESSSPKDS